MKKAILKFTGIAAVVALLSFNIQLFDDQSKITLDNLANVANAQDTEYPHYGSYGRTMMDCSATVVIGSSGQVCAYGICVDGEAGAEVTISCTNCAWDCNTSGANNTCDPADC